MGEGLGEEVLDLVGGVEAESAVGEGFEEAGAVLEGFGLGGGVFGKNAVIYEAGERL